MVKAFEMVGLDMKGAPDATFSLARFAFELGAWAGFVPTRLSVELDRLAVPLAIFEREMTGPKPSDIGYTEMPVSAGLVQTFDAAGRRLGLDRLRIALHGAFTFEASATLGALGPEISELREPDRLEQNAMRLTPERVRLRFVDDGFVGRLLAFRERTERVPPAQQLEEALAIARAAMVGTVRDPELRRRFDTALTRFLSNPRSLTVDIRPRQPMTVAQIMSALQSRDPFARFDFEISANE